MDNKLIGRFSSLACANLTHITSYYNGVQYTYLMLKNGNSINIDKIDERPTEEKNGVEVKIVVSNIDPYVDALKYMHYVPNLYVHASCLSIRQSNHVERFNERFLYDHGKYVVTSAYDYDWHGILVGNVVYPINKEYLDLNERNTGAIWKRVFPKFAIGELDITPNREQLLYSDKTVKALKARYKEVKDELIAIAKNMYDQSFTDIIKYYEEVTSSYRALRLEDEISVPITDTFLEPYAVPKYDAKRSPELASDKAIINAIRNLLYTYMEDAIIYDKRDGKYTKAKCRISFNRFRERHQKFRIIGVPSLANLRGDVFSEYIMGKLNQITDCENPAFVFFPSTFSLKAMTSALQGNIVRVLEEGTITTTDWHKTIWLYRELKRHFGKNVCYCDVVNSTEYLKFRDATLKRRRAERKANAVQIVDKVRFYARLHDRYDSVWEKYTDVSSIDDLVRDIKNVVTYHISNKPVPVYWAIKDTPEIALWEELTAGQPRVIVTVAKGNYKYIKDAKLPGYWREVTEDFIVHSRPLGKYLTARKSEACRMSSDMALTHWLRDRFFVNPSNRYLRNWNSPVTFCRTATNHRTWFEELASKYKGADDSQVIEYFDACRKVHELSEALYPIVAVFNAHRPSWLEMYALAKLKKVKLTAAMFAVVLKNINNNFEKVKEYEDAD